MAIRPVAFAVLAATWFLSGCVTEDVGSASPGSGSSAETVKERIAAFETLQGKDYENNLELLSGLLREPAFEGLVDALSGASSDKVRAGCAMALAMGQNDRAREPLFRAAQDDSNPGVRNTAAYGLCLYRDSRGLPVLFAALRSENSQHRWSANDLLKRVTSLDFAFEATATPELREAAVARWEAWYKQVGPSGASLALVPPRDRPK